MKLLPYMQRRPDAEPFEIGVLNDVKKVSYTAFVAPSEVHPTDIERVMLRGTGSGEPLGILNTPGIKTVFVPDRKSLALALVQNLRPHDLVVATPSLYAVLQGLPLLYSSWCSGEGVIGTERVIVGDFSGCQYGINASSEMVFSAAGADLRVLGGWD